MKFKQKIQDDSLKEIENELIRVRKEQADMFKMMQNVELSTSKNLLKTMYGEWSKDHNKDEPKNITHIQS